MTNKFTLVLSGLVVFGLAACEEKKANDEAVAEPTVEAAATEPAVAAEPAAAAEPATEAGKPSTALKDYEKFVDSFIAVAKKVKEGDAAAAQDLVKLTEKSDEWAKKLAVDAESMTEADLAKLQELMTKLAKAIVGE